MYKGLACDCGVSRVLTIMPYHDFARNILLKNGLY